MTALAIPGALAQPYPGEAFVPPQHLWVPDHVSSAVDEATDLMSALGRPLDAEQRLALSAFYAERRDGRWAAFEVGLVACRQNLKSYVLEASVLTDLFLLGQGLITWTAHLFSTTQEAFRNIQATIEAHDFLGKRVLKVSTANGEEGVELRSGARLNFRARSKTGGRGVSGDVVILDEALFLKVSEMGSLMPTVSARPNPQIRYGSSAGVADSLVLRRLRDRGRRGGDAYMAWLEWCAPGSWLEPGCRATLLALEHPGAHLEPCAHAPGTPGCVLDDRAAWAAGNPAAGRRIEWERIAAERASMDPAEFGRERLGWWDEAAAEVQMPRAIDVDLWGTRADPASYARDPVALGIDVSPTGSDTAIAACGWRAGRTGVKHAEVIATGEGTGWVVDWLAERLVGDATNPPTWKPVAVALDAGSEAGRLVAPLRARGIELVLLGSRDVAAAAGMLDADVREQGLTHPGQEEMTTALDNTTWRSLAGARAFARIKPAATIAPVIALSIAGWALVAKHPHRPALAAPRSLPPMTGMGGIEGPGSTLPGGGDLDVMTAGF